MTNAGKIRKVENELAKVEFRWKNFNLFILSKTNWWKCSLSAIEAGFFLFSLLKIEKTVSTTGQKKISNIDQAVISGFLTSKRIATQHKQCPWKYAPPSPKKIFPQGKFNRNNPNELRKNTRQSKTTNASDVIQATTVKKKDVDKDIPSDKPFNPSMTLNEWATPVVANIVNNMAKGDNKKSWSIKKTSTLFNHVFSKTLAIIDDVDAANNR